MDLADDDAGEPGDEPGRADDRPVHSRRGGGLPLLGGTCGGWPAIRVSLSDASHPRPLASARPRGRPPGPAPARAHHRHRPHAGGLRDDRAGPGPAARHAARARARRRAARVGRGRQGLRHRRRHRRRQDARHPAHRRVDPRRSRSASAW
ncbi:MAG: hypothetical protein MZU84_04920 [Sphingobacterium sp.]|nr:hypothetical protein [Sphingobacterium sp.]